MMQNQILQDASKSKDHPQLLTDDLVSIMRFIKRGREWFDHEADFVFKSHTLWPEEGSVGDLILTSNEV